LLRQGVSRRRAPCYPLSPRRLFRAGPPFERVREFCGGNRILRARLGVWDGGVGLGSVLDKEWGAPQVAGTLWGAEGASGHAGVSYLAL
jgi:hypothetical protein